MNRVDFLFKHHIGRLGFDADRPWYEEATRAPPLVPFTSVMCDPLPATLPSLIRGGVLTPTSIAGDDATGSSSNHGSYNSQGDLVESGVVTARIRLPLFPVRAYRYESPTATATRTFYVYVDEHSRLERACTAYGCVVEVLRGSDRIEAAHIPYTVLSGHVVFEGGSWQEEERLYVSFYEYTGRFGIEHAPALAPDGGDEGGTNGAPAQDAPPDNGTSTSSAGCAFLTCSTDSLCEGVSHLFYTEERFRHSLLTITTDDVPMGPDAIEKEEAVTLALSHLRSTLSACTSNVTALDASIPDRIRDSNLADLRESEASMHFNARSFGTYLANTTTDALREGETNRFLTADGLLALAQAHLTTDAINESRSRLYLTPARVHAVALPLIDERIGTLSVGDVAGSVGMPQVLSVASDVEARVLRLSEAHMATVEAAVRDGLTTDSVEEGESRLYFTQERVRHVVEPIADAIVSRVESISIESLASRLPDANDRPVTLGSLDTWLGTKTLDDIADGPDRTLLRQVHVHESISALALTPTGSTTDDLKEGRANVYFSEERVRHVLRTTSVDVMLVGEGTFIPAKVDERIDQRLLSLTLDSVTDGSTRRLVSTDTVQQMITRGTDALTLSSLAPGDTAVHFRHEHERALSAASTQCTTVLPGLVSAAGAMQEWREGTDVLLETLARQTSDAAADAKGAASSVRELTTDSVPEGAGAGAGAGARLYFTPERAVAAVVPTLSTRDVPDRADGPFYFTTERCVSVCAIVNAPIVQQLSELADGADGVRADVLRLHDACEESRLDAAQRLASVAAGLQTSLDVHTAAIAELDRATSTAAAVLPSLLDEAFDTRALTLETKHIAESEAGPHYFTRDRSLSVHREVYDRVGTLEERLADTHTRVCGTEAAQAIESGRLHCHLQQAHTPSDERLVVGQAEPLGSALAAISALRPLVYASTLTLEQTAAEATPRVGFIAQHVLDESAMPRGAELLRYAATPGDATSPSSLNYDSITTVAVGAIQELSQVVSRIDQRTTDDIQEGQANKWLTQQAFERLHSAAMASVTTDDIAEGKRHAYWSPPPMSTGVLLEDFRFLLGHVTTDDIAEGETNRYFHQPTSGPDGQQQHASRTAGSTDEVAEGEINLYYTDARCERVLDSRLATLSTDDISESESRGFLTLERLRRELRYISADHISNGFTNKYLTMSSFAGLGITSDNIAEGSRNVYFTAGRCREAIIGTSTDLLIEGTRNLFATPSSVRSALVFLTTADLNEAPTRRYVSRDAFFDLHISVGDIVGHEALARAEEVDEALGAARLGLSQDIQATGERADEAIAAARLELLEGIRHTDTRATEAVHAVRLELREDIDAVRARSDEAVASARQELEASIEQSTRETREELVEAMDAAHRTLEQDVLGLSSLSHEHTLRLDEQHTLGLSTSRLLGSVSASLASLDARESANDRTHTLGLARQVEAHASLHASLLVAQDSLSVQIVRASLSVASAAAETYVSKETFANLTTSGVRETTGRRFVSEDAIAEAGVTTDVVVEGSDPTRRYATRDTVRSLLRDFTTDDLPESQARRYVSREAVVATRLTADDLVGFGAHFDALFAMRLSDASTDALVEGETHLYYTPQRAAEFFASVSSDGLREGETHLYFTAARAVDALRTTTSDAVPEGTRHRYLSRPALRALCTTDDLPEGESHLYFTPARVREELTASSSDALREGTVNKYATRANVLSLDLDVSDLRDTRQALLTDDAFLQKAAGLLTTDAVREGVRHRYVSPSSVRDSLAHLTTDDVPEGGMARFYSDALFDASLARKTSDDIIEGSTQRFFSTDLLTEWLTRARVLSTGITARDIGARPDDVPLTTAELLESEQGLFFTQERVREVLSLALASTDDVPEGAHRLYHTRQRVESIVRSVGSVAVVCTPGAEPACVSVVASLTETQVLGGTLCLSVWTAVSTPSDPADQQQQQQVLDAAHHASSSTSRLVRSVDLPLQSSVTHVFAGLVPGEELIVRAQALSRYGSTEVASCGVTVPGTAVVVTAVGFPASAEEEEEEGPAPVPLPASVPSVGTAARRYTDRMEISFSGHGSFHVTVSVLPVGFELHSSTREVEDGPLVLPLSAVFRQAVVVVTQGSMHVHTFYADMPCGLVRPLTKDRFAVRTDASFSASGASARLYAGLRLDVVCSIGTLDGNARVSYRTDSRQQTVDCSSASSSAPAGNVRHGAVVHATRDVLTFGVSRGTLFVDFVDDCAEQQSGETDDCHGRATFFELA